MASVLKISDGTTTVDFLNADNVYRVSSWLPAVAAHRRGELGGRGPYEDVTEQMVISIKSATAHSKLATLRDLLDQADRWGRGEPVDAVLLHYQVESSSEELKTLILGGPIDDPSIELPANFIWSAQTDMIDEIVLRFRRLGLWFGPEAAYESGAASTMPVAMSVAIPDLNPIGYPVKLRLEGIEDWMSNLYDAFILMSSAPSSDAGETRIKLVGGIVFNSSASGYSSQSDSANKPSNGSTVLRYAPSTTAETPGANYALTNISATSRRWGVFLNYRNNSATTDFYIRFAFSGLSSLTYTPQLVVPGGTNNPIFAYVGDATLDGPIDDVQILIETSAASGSIDIDLVAFVALDSPRTSRVLSILNPETDTSLAANDFIIDHRLLSHIAPVVYFDDTADMAVPYGGDATIFLTDVYVYFTCLVTGGERNPTHWRPSDGTTVYTNKCYVTARTAYLIPE